MTKTWTNQETKQEIRVVVVKKYQDFEPMLLVHKEGATSSMYVFSVRASQCR